MDGENKNGKPTIATQVNPTNDARLKPPWEASVGWLRPMTPTVGQGPGIISFGLRILYILYIRADSVRVRSDTTAIAVIVYTVYKMYKYIQYIFKI